MEFLDKNNKKISKNFKSNSANLYGSVELWVISKNEL